MGQYTKTPSLVGELRRTQAQAAQLSANPPVKVIAGVPTEAADDGHLRYDRTGGTLYVRAAGTWEAI